ncbi:HET domain containing protein [Hyaloscypha variabilis]
MRLIEAKTLKMEEFFGDQIPPYAILSHTWHHEEVSFQDWADRSSASQKKGYEKIIGACQLAEKHGHDYLWVDTNCIGKSSSSELSEAINLMFKWYQFAQVCYVYLADVPSPEATSTEMALSGLEFSELFRLSRWFTRGWTLQELLAPRDIEFYSNDLSLLGTKNSLRNEISSITGIDIQYLWRELAGDIYIGNLEKKFIAQSIQHATPLRKASVGEMFSWLSHRTTTRLEDMAYCMLGIFELNMPLLYGEGSKAFTRLQEEIMKVSDDHTLFCWAWNTSQNRGSFLSEVPSAYKQASRIVPKQADKRPAPYTFTNAGLSIRLPILHSWESSFIGVLRVSSGNGKILGLPMSGDLDTGLVYRKQFPPVPIILCDGIPETQEHDVFVSENYIKQSPHGGSIDSSQYAKNHEEREFAVISTFEEKGMVRETRTFPEDRFDPVRSSISIYLDRRFVENNWGYKAVLTNFGHFGDRYEVPRGGHTYEGVLVHLELRTGGSQSFMIAVKWRRLEDDQDRLDTHWKWYCWPILSGQIIPNPNPLIAFVLRRSSPIVELFHQAMLDPDRTQALSSDKPATQVSISIASDCSRLYNGNFVSSFIPLPAGITREEAAKVSKGFLLVT